jgi:PAS domain S-box-containing protein
MRNHFSGKSFPLHFAPIQVRWRTTREKIAQLAARVDASERNRLLSHAFALASVTVAVALQAQVAGAATGMRFWLLQAAVALAASYGTLSTIAVAILASVLAVRITSGADLTTCFLFSVEGFVISLVVLQLRESLKKQQNRTAEADKWILELKSSDRRGRLIDRAFNRLDEVATDAVIVVLDREGHIVDWRAGATRLYGRKRDDMLGSSVSALFSPELSDEKLAGLLSEAMSGAAEHTGPHRRVDGTFFTADVEFKPLSRGGYDGFTMIVRDLTRQEAWDAFATSATEAHARLRSEADVAHDQLATLQYLTDPSLNTLDSAALVKTLLNRLRSAIEAEGIAVVHTGRFERHVVCASGLQCMRRASQLPPDDLSGDEPVRALIIHNDAASVSEMSTGQWPAGVSSLIAVPVVCAGSTEAVIEVVSATRRRATEWEIALIQVVAARIAGLIHHDPFADAGAA